MMHPKRMLRVAVFGALIACAAAVGTLWWSAGQSEQSGNAQNVAAPAFWSVAKAEDAEITGVIQDEAGISAWFNAGTNVDLNLVKNAYRVVETQTADYILGSVKVPGYSLESDDVHLYVHRNGWFLAYYFKDDPIGKMIDWANFNASYPTRFENVLSSVVAAAGLPAPQSVTHYDFRYPNATKLLFIYEDSANGSDFNIKIPGSYVYYARSWSVLAWWSPRFLIDGKVIGSPPGCDRCARWGDIPPTDLAPDVMHTVVPEVHAGILALLYRDTP